MVKRAAACMLADEPTANLDAENSHNILRDHGAPEPRAGHDVPLRHPRRKGDRLPAAHDHPGRRPRRQRRGMPRQAGPAGGGGHDHPDAWPSRNIIGAGHPRRGSTRSILSHRLRGDRLEPGPARRHEPAGRPGDRRPSEFGGGQYWHADYDPYDPLTPARTPTAPFPRPLQQPWSTAGKAAARPGHPGTASIRSGRMRLGPAQGHRSRRRRCSTFPTAVLAPRAGDDDPAGPHRRAGWPSAGRAQARRLRSRCSWRDAARQRSTPSDARDRPGDEDHRCQSIDQQPGLAAAGSAAARWPRMPGEATLVVLARALRARRRRAGGWLFRDQDYLLADIREPWSRPKVCGRSIFLRHPARPGHAGDLRHPGAGHLPPAARDRHADGPGLHPRPGHPRSSRSRACCNGVLAVSLVAAAYGIPLLRGSARAGWALPGRHRRTTGFAIGETPIPDVQRRAWSP
ncbi:MAG: hypothetical protein MZV64_42815 [Ignavibacteriales bacterium]|nr:hypothetical protein [Ignavibacteriales bacterium]